MPGKTISKLIIGTFAQVATAVAEHQAQAGEWLVVVARNEDGDKGDVLFVSSRDEAVQIADFVDDEPDVSAMCASPGVVCVPWLWWRRKAERAWKGLPLSNVLERLVSRRKSSLPSTSLPR